MRLEDRGYPRSGSVVKWRNGEGARERREKGQRAKWRIDVDMIYKDEAYKIIGAFFEVYKEKGCGFLEEV